MLLNKPRVEYFPSGISDTTMDYNYVSSHTKKVPILFSFVYFSPYNVIYVVRLFLASAHSGRYSDWMTSRNVVRIRHQIGSP